MNATNISGGAAMLVEVSDSFVGNRRNCKLSPEKRSLSAEETPSRIQGALHGVAKISKDSMER